MKKETFLYLDGHTEYHEVDDNAVYHHVTDDNRLNYRVDVNDATFEWHNNAWMQVQIMLNIKKSLLMQSLCTNSVHWQSIQHAPSVLNWCTN